MRNIVKAAALLCVGSLGFVASNAVGGSTVLGNNCVSVQTPQLGPAGPVIYSSGGAIANALYGTTDLAYIHCPTIVDHQLSSTVTFRARVIDNSATNGFSCKGIAYDQDGTVVAQTTSATTGGSATGPSTLSKSVTVPNQSMSYTYALYCTMPENQSAISTVRVY